MNRFTRFVLISLFSSAVMATASAQYQLPNPGFEGEWNPVSQNGKSGYEPTGWHSFLSMKTGGTFYNSAIALKLEPSTDVRPGSSGTQSAKIWSNAINLVFFKVVANGNLTTGQIYGGSTSATDASGNYNFSDPSNTGYNQTFTGKPDSIVQWVKYVPINSGNKARVSAIIHENSRYQDPEATTYTNVVAKAQMNYPATSDKGWQRLSVPFTYESGEKVPAYILISYSTSETPGGGDENDAVYIDDIEMIYNSRLKTIAFNGSDFKLTDGDYDYDLSSGGTYYPETVAATVDGVSASYEIEKTSGNVMTVTVNGGDISANPANKHVYTFTFAQREYKVSVASDNSTMGSAYIGEAGTTSTTVKEGSPVTVTAVANAHYEFAEWVDGSDNGVSTQAVYTIPSVTGNMTLTAKFRPVMHTVSATCDTEAGSVSVGDGGSASQQVQDGNSITVTAVAKEGYIFEEWRNSDGEKVSGNASYTVDNVTSDLSFTAIFAELVESDLSFELDGTQRADLEEGSFSNTASATDSEGEITYSITASSSDGIATVDAATGTVTLLGAGTVTVTATQEAWGRYLETVAEYELEIVSAPSGVEESSAAADVNVYGVSGGIMITGVTCNTSVKVYSLSSIMVENTEIAADTRITVPCKGIYLVDVTAGSGRKVFRVAVK